MICLERAGELAARLPSDVPVVVAGKQLGNDPRAAYLEIDVIDRVNHVAGAAE